MVHPEIVLQRDGGESLRGGLDLDILLGLDSLVKSVAPTAALHDTSGLLIHNLDLVVDNDVVHVLLEHRIGLEQLDDSVHTLALERVVLHQRVLLLLLLLGGKLRVLLDLGDLAADVRKHEEIRIGHSVSEKVMSLVGHVHRMLLLADHEIKLVGDDVHLPLVVLHIVVLGLLQQLLHALLAEELDERLVLRESFVGTEKEHTALVLLAGGDGSLGVVQHLGHESALLLVKTLHIRSELHVLLVILGLGHRTGDDQWRTGVVDEHGVNLIDNGVVMLDLNKVGHVHCHIVTKVVETELVVGSESDRTVIGPLSGIAVRLMLVDAVHRKTVEHVERTHPLRVTLGEVVVDGDDMHTLARQGVKEHRKCRHKSLALTGSHLGDLSLMKHNTTDQLNIIVNHVPSHLVAAGDPMVLVDSLVSLDVDKIMIDAERPVEIVGRNLDGRVLLEPAGR